MSCRQNACHMLKMTMAYLTIWLLSNKKQQIIKVSSNADLYYIFLKVFREQRGPFIQEPKRCLRLIMPMATIKSTNRAALDKNRSIQTQVFRGQAQSDNASWQAAAY